MQRVSLMGFFFFAVSTGHLKETSCLHLQLQETFLQFAALVCQRPSLKPFTEIIKWLINKRIFTWGCFY